MSLCVCVHVCVRVHVCVCPTVLENPKMVWECHIPLK